MAERQSVAEAEESAVEAEGQPAMLTEAEANEQPAAEAEAEGQPAAKVKGPAA